MKVVYAKDYEEKQLVDQPRKEKQLADIDRQEKQLADETRKKEVDKTVEKKKMKDIYSSSSSSEEDSSPFSYPSLKKGNLFYIKIIIYYICYLPILI